MSKQQSNYRVEEVFFLCGYGLIFTTFILAILFRILKG